MPAQGLQRDAAALQRQWDALEPRLRGSVAVRGAYIGALCACDALGEAAAALHRMLDLYAALYSNGAPATGPRAVHDPAAQEAQPRLSGLCRDQGGPAAAEALDAGADTNAGWRQAGMDAPDGASSIQRSLSNADEDLAQPGGAAGSVSGSLHARRGWGSAAQAAGVDGAEEAARTAAQACHQVIHAAGRAGAADVAHAAALAMHEVMPPLAPAVVCASSVCCD